MINTAKFSGQIGIGIDTKSFLASKYRVILVFHEIRILFISFLLI